MSSKQKGLALAQNLVIATLWEGALSKYFQFIWLIGSEAQCLAILLWSRFTFVLDPKSLSLPMQTLSEIVTKGNFAVHNPSSILMITYLTLVGVYFLVFLSSFIMIIYHYYKGKSLSSSKQKLITYLGQIHLVVGFWYCSTILLHIIMKDSIRRNITSLLADFYLIIYIPSIILVSINYLIGLFFALFSYDPFLTTNVLCCHSTSFQVLTFLFKAVVVPFTVLSEDSITVQWYLLSLSLLILALRHYDLLRSFPYYCYTTMRIALVFSSISLMTCFLNMFTMTFKASGPIDPGSMIYVQFVLTVLAAKLSDSYFQYEVLRFIRMPHDNLTSERKVLKKLFAIRHFLKNRRTPVMEEGKSDENEIHFWGILTRYLRASKAKKGNLSGRDELTNHIEGLNLKEFRNYCSLLVKKILKSLLQEMDEKLRNSSKLKILLVSSFLESPLDAPISVTYLIAIAKIRGFARVIASKLNRKVQQDIHSSFITKEGESLDIKTHIDQENISDQFMRLIHSISKKHYNFWMIYSLPNLKVMDLYYECRKIESEYEQVEQFWKKNIESNKQFASSLSVVYCLYLSLARNRPVLAAKLLAKYKVRVLEDYTSEQGTFFSEKNLNSYNTLTFAASMSKETLGNILSISSHIMEVLGWNPEDVITKNVNLLMPLLMREKHNQILQRHIDRIKEPSNLKRLNKVLDTFVLQRNGYISPCQVFISIHPYIQQELVYIAIITLKNDKEDYIIVDENGNVGGITRNLGKILNIRPNERVHIEEVYKDYPEHEKIFRERISFQDVFLTITLNNLPPSRKEVKNNYTFQAQLLFAKLDTSHIFVLRLIPDSENFSYFNSAPLRLHNISKDEIKLDYSYRETGNEEKIRAPLFSPAIRLSSENCSMRKLFEFSNSFPHEGQVTTIKTTKEDPDTPIFIKESEKRTFSEEIIAFRQERTARQEINFANRLAIGTSDGSSKGSWDKYDEKIEETVHMIPKNKRLRLLEINMILFILAAPIILLVFQLQNNYILNLLQGNIKIISQKTWMLSEVIEINRVARFISLIDSGVLVGNRNGADLTVSGLKNLSIPHLVQYMNSAGYYRNSVKGSLCRINIDLQKKIYQFKVPVNEFDENKEIISTRTSTIFDFITDLIATSSKLVSQHPENLNGNNPGINFILNNTFNEFLIYTDQIIPLFLSDSQGNLQMQTRKTIGIASVMTFLGILMVTNLYKLIKYFRRRRDQFLNILLRIENEHIGIHVTMLNSFIFLLEENKFSSKSFTLKTSRGFFLSPATHVKSKHLTSSRKLADFQNINNRILQLSAGIFGFIVSLLGIYFCLLIITGIQSADISNRISLMVKSNDYFYQILLLFTLQYEYVQENITSLVRNKPISEEWDTKFQDLARNQGFFLTELLDKDRGFGSNEDLSKLIKGNICDMIQVESSELNNKCRTIRGSLLQNGIVGLNSYYLSLLDHTASSFKDSSRTGPDMIQALNSIEIVAAENITYWFAIRAYHFVDELIQSELMDNINSYKGSFQTIIIVYSVFGVLVGMVVWFKLNQLFWRELSLWKKIIRQVPWEAVISNKLLKAYLVEKNQGSLMFLK